MKFMEDLKNKVKSLFEGDYRGIAILFILELILFITIQPNRYDDASYIQSVTGTSVLSFAVYRYQNWTSRILIEATLATIFQVSKYLWIFGTVFCMTLIGYSISKLFIKKENKKELIMMVLWLILLYPIDRISNAGWAATTVNYIWPLAFGLYSLIPVRKAFDREKITLLHGILYALAAIYACNQELVCGVLLITYVLFVIILTIRDKKKVSPFIYLLTLIAIASLIFILTTPGNSIRKLDEIVSWFPDYISSTFVEKLVLGVTTTMGEMICSFAAPFIMFTLMLLIYVWSNYKDRLVRGISAVPFTATAFLGFLSPITANIASVPVNWIKTEFAKETAIITPESYAYIGTYVELILSLVVIICIILSLLLIFRKVKNNIALYVFICGLATRVLMGFSPTVFVSGNRTCVFLEFACLICTLLIWQEFIKKSEKKSKTRIYNIVVWASIVQYVVSLSYVYITHINV